MLKNYDKIKEYLKKHPSVAIDVAREINGCNGKLSFVDTWDLTELISCYCADYQSTRQFLENIILNSLDTLTSDIDAPVRFSEDGDYIETIYDEDLEKEVLDYINDIMENLDKLWNSDDIDIDNKYLLDLLFDLETDANRIYARAEKHYKGSEINADTLMSVARKYYNFSEEQLKQLEEKFIADEQINM